MKKYENQEIGISFDYPSDWISIDNCKITQGINVSMYKDTLSFGIIIISSKLRKDNNNNSKDLEQVLIASVLINETIIEGVKLNKYIIENADSATILLNRWNGNENMIHERTLVMRKNDDKTFMIAYEDIPENFESGFAQKQINDILKSFRSSI